MSPRTGAKLADYSADISADIPYPSTTAIEESLKLLRRNPSPLAPESVRVRLDLLLVPFARLFEQFEDRAACVKPAAELACETLSEKELTILRHVLFAPSDRRVQIRRDKALEELVESGALPPESSARAITHIEEQALTKLATALTSEAFAQTFAASKRLPRVKRTRSSYRLPSLVKTNYCWSLDFAEDDPRRQTCYRAVKIYAVAESHRIYIDRFYTTGSEPKPRTVEMLSDADGHSWLATKRDLRRNRPKTWWWTNLFHLGYVLEQGEATTVRWREEFWDEDREISPHIAIIATPAMETLTLAIRVPHRGLPPPAEARIIDTPLDNHDVRTRWTCLPNDAGWYIEQFTDIESHVEYGIYLPDDCLYG